jgi:hypothetical protein
MRAELFSCLMIFGIAWTLTQAYRTQIRHQEFLKLLEVRAQMHTRLLDRLGADPAAIDLLKNQQSLLDVKLPSQSGYPSSPYWRVLTSVQASGLLLCAGVGCLISRAQVEDSGDRLGFLFLGTMGIALGMGALLSGVAAFVAARLWFTAEHRAERA